MKGSHMKGEVKADFTVGEAKVLLNSQDTPCTGVDG